MRRIAANYIFPITSDPVRDGYVDLADDGTVIGTGRLTEETGSTEFYNGILVPGFTNAHCHIELSHLEGKFREATGMSGFIDQINALRESAPAEERQKAMRAQFDKLYREGVSAMADISNCDESFAMKKEGPMYTRTFIEVFGSEPQDAPAVIEDARKLAAKAAEAGIDAAITPHSPYTMSSDLLRMASAEGLKAGYISYHNQESQEEDDMIGFHRGPLYENYINRGLSTVPATGRPAVFHFLDRLQEVHPAPFEEHILLIHNTVAHADPEKLYMGHMPAVQHLHPQDYGRPAHADEHGCEDSRRHRQPLVQPRPVHGRGIQMHTPALPRHPPADCPDMGLPERCRRTGQGRCPGLV